MRLGEILKKYRSEHGLSQRKFADLCGDVTNGYISMIENEYNPSTGKKVVPSIDKLTSLARGMGMSLQELIDLSDDINPQDANDTASVGECLLNYMILFGDTADDIAKLLNISVEDVNRVIASDLDLTYRQAELLANRYGISIDLLYDDDEEEEPAPKSGSIDEAISCLIGTLRLNEKQQILGLLQVMSEAHKSEQAPDDQGKPTA